MHFAPSTLIHLCKIPLRWHLPVLVAFTFFFGCQKSDKPVNNLDHTNPFINYVKNSSNPGDSLYKTQVENRYKQYKAKNQQDSCVNLLIAYGTALYTNAMGSAFFKQSALHYLQNLEQDSTSVSHFALVNMLASTYAWEGKIDSAKYWYHQALNGYDEYKLQKANGFASSELGIIYFSNSQLDSAEHYYIKAVKSFENVKDTYNLIVNYMHVSSVFESLHAWNLAEQYINKSYNLAKAYNRNELLLGTIYMKGILLSDGFADSLGFIDLVDTAKVIYRNYKQPSLYDQFAFYTMLFDQSVYLQNWDSAKLVLSYADSINKIMEHGGIQEQIDYRKCIYNVQVNKTLPNEVAADSMAKSLSSQKAFIIASRLYNALAINAKLKLDYQASLVYTNLYHSCLDSLYVHNAKGQLLEMEKKYKTAQKEKLITIQQVKLNRYKFQLVLLILTLLGVLFGIFIYLNYRKRKEAKLEIVRQQEFTDALLQNTEDERKRIATDLHDGINHELLTLKNQANNGAEVSSTDIEKVIADVRKISRDLYPVMFENIGLAASIEALCERLTSAGLFTTCEINYTLQLTKRNELQLYRIIQEALNNTLKHAKANAAKVTIATLENELWVEIQDNGIGFDSDAMLKKGTSFGIQSVLQRARAMGGKSTIHSTSNGTKLILTTPLH